MPTLSAYRQRLARDLADEDYVVYSEGDVDRAIERSIEDLNRFLPQEKREDISISDLDITDEAFTTHATAGTHKVLANTNIQPRSDTATLVSTGAGLSRGTDYEIDYVLGTIAWLAGSTKLSGTDSITVTYKKDRLSVDISALSIIKIEKVEYVAGETSIEFSSFDLWGNRLFLTTKGSGSQRYFEENSNLIIWYTAPHLAPTMSSEGTVAPAMSEVIQKGALFYALFTRSLGYKLNVKSNLDLATTRLGSIGAIHTTLITEQTNLALAIGLINSTLDGVSFLDPAGVLATMNTRMAAAATSAGHAITAIFGDGAFIPAVSITAGNTDLTNAATYVATAITSASEVDFDLAANDLNAADTRIDDMDEAFADLETDWSLFAGTGISDLNMLTDIGSESAFKYLKDGDAFLNTVNLGQNQAENYALYARETVRIVETVLGRLQLWRDQAIAQVQAASAYVDSARAAIEQEATKVQKALAESQASSVAVASAQAEASLQGVLLAKASVFTNIAGVHNATARLELEQQQTVIAQAQGYALEAQYRVARMDQYLQEIDRYLAQSSEYRMVAEGLLNLAEDLMTQASIAQNEYFTVLRERVGFRRQTSTVSVNQPHLPEGRLRY